MGALTALLEETGLVDNTHLRVAYYFNSSSAVLNLWVMTPLGVERAFQINIPHLRYLYYNSQQ